MEAKKMKLDEPMLIWHNGAEVIECGCGKIINGKHKCTKDIKSKKLCVTECGYNTERRYRPLREVNLACDICQKDAKQKEYDEQWAVDFDGYDVCSECHGKCTYGVLPKECECPNPETSGKRDKLQVVRDACEQ